MVELVKAMGPGNFTFIVFALIVGVYWVIAHTISAIENVKTAKYENQFPSTPRPEASED